MDYKGVLYKKLNNIAKITLNRPETMNAQNRLVLEAIDSAFAKADEDDEVKVIILAGAGKHFSSGHDLGSAEMKEDLKERPWPKTAWESMRRTDKIYRDYFLRWRNIGKPTIAAIQGYCIMGGWMLASVCDIVIASEDAMFTDRSVRWGGAHVQFFTLPWDIGPRKTKEYLWTGDFIDAREAYRLGMVNRVVARDRLEKETIAIARKIALCSSDTLRMSKASINQQMDIMGQSTAIVASYNIGSIMQALRTNGEPPKGVKSARERDEAFKD